MNPFAPCFCSVSKPRRLCFVRKTGLEFIFFFVQQIQITLLMWCQITKKSHLEALNILSSQLLQYHPGKNPSNPPRERALDDSENDAACCTC